MSATKRPPKEPLPMPSWLLGPMPRDIADWDPRGCVKCGWPATDNPCDCCAIKAVAMTGFNAAGRVQFDASQAARDLGLTDSSQLDRLDTIARWLHDLGCFLREIA